MTMASASVAVSQSSCQAQAIGLAAVCGTSTASNGRRRVIRPNVELVAMASEKTVGRGRCCFVGAAAAASPSSSSSCSSSCSTCASSSPSSSPKQHRHIRFHAIHDNQRGPCFGHCAPLRSGGSSSCRSRSTQTQRNRVPAAAAAAGGGRGTGRRLSVVAMASSSSSGEELPSLSSLQLTPYVNEAGEIGPPQDADSEASVFVVFDADKKAQYVGFSKDVRNSLRTLLCRRPELCFFYSVFNLPSLDQQKMLAIRSHWYSELGNAPAGNGQAEERVRWEKPFEASSKEAAQDRIQRLLTRLEERGVKEKMEFDPALLEEGKVDVVASTDAVAASTSSSSTKKETESRTKHVSITGPDGQLVEFDVFYQRKFPTNGGWMYDVRVMADKLETTHRVIVGRVYPESVGITEDEFLERTLAFMLAKKLPRRTEGMLTSDQFPVNYFSVSEVEQWYGDFKLMFTDGDSLLPGEAGYWRFNRIHKYGPSEDSVPLVGPSK